MQITEIVGEYPLAALSGIAATALMFWVLRGMVPMLAYRQRRLAWHLAAAAVLLMAGGAGRSIYWEGLSIVFDGEARRAIRGAFGGMNVNLAFNAMLIWSGLHWLKVLHLLIPEDERPGWSMWAAPCWPSRTLWPSALEALRDLWKSRRR